MDKLCFKEKSENLLKCWRSDIYGLHIIYSARLMGRYLAECKPFKGTVDYFCDKDAQEIKSCRGIPVIDHNELNKIIKDSGKKAIIIICTGPGGRGVSGIYGDLLQNECNADVFDYFENETCFIDKSFSFNGKKITLFEHRFNTGYCNTRMTERSLEIPLAKEFLALCDGKVTEVGAVTPYYFWDERIERIIDPTDKHYRVTEKKSMFDCDIQGENILSISTVEHIGTSDYGMNESYTVIDAIEHIIKQANSYFITAPLGYNLILDEWVKEQFQRHDLSVAIRGCNNHWEIAEDLDQIKSVEYTPYWANGVVILCNKWG